MRRLLVACAWCGRIDLDGWVEEEVALRRLRSYEWPVPPGFTHTICDDCFECLRRKREMSRVEMNAA